ncbi:uncharacterized protein LOC129180299 [Dunckerocampus dactyliophorus]|uniref:uncharacterized protein LOC129180299 n=1 Tax=Dunckerocampus dactyliophorus TaxID=161453 RepID=UPI002405C30E|nr:uncharacterized protein LOC129180299 [Dunckerocampus dactyliophorus]
MFSRNRSNGQHGASVPPKGGTKAKVTQPKKRAPNPKVALVIRGKIHRLLQGSADHRVPDPQDYYAEDVEREKCEVRKDHRRIYPKTLARDEVPSSSKLSNGKGDGGPPCVGEVELNREGCLRIPCTLQRKSSKSPANRKRISFEGLLPLSPELTRAATRSSSAGPDKNGVTFDRPGGRDFAAPRVRPKRPYSAGDTLDYDFNTALPEPLVEEGQGHLGEEQSSAIIEHILKELRGINKIQEEISDLRDYLTSVKGSVEEVSSCVDAVLLEIEGIRSSSKVGSGADTWLGEGYIDGSSPRRRPASVHGSLGRSAPKSASDNFPEVCKVQQGVHRELRPPRAEDYSVSPVAESVNHQDLEEFEDTSDISSDIPEGALTRKLSLRYQERQDCPDCLSTSSLSSQSSKSESDLDRPTSCHERTQEIAPGAKEYWTTTKPLHRTTDEHLWDEEPSYREDHKVETCFDGVADWDHYRTLTQCSSRSLEHRSRQRYNSAGRTSRREEWQTRRSRSQSGILTTAYSADCSYPKSSGYHSFDGHYGASNGFDYGPSNDCHVGSYQESYFTYQDSTAVTWSEASRCSSEKTLIPGTETRHQNQVPYPGSSDIQPSFDVRRISRAVSDFSSALRGALRKLEVPADQNPEDETDLEVSAICDMSTSELPTKSFSWDIVSQNFPLEKSHFSFEESSTLEFAATSQHYPSLEMIPTGPEEHLVFISQAALPPDDLTEHHAGVVEDRPPDNTRAELSQHTTTESLSASVLAEQASGQLREGQQASTDTAEREAGEVSQTNERNLKCLRSFQQILREKREMRRNLASMSTLSQEDFEPGRSAAH